MCHRSLSCYKAKNRVSKYELLARLKLAAVFQAETSFVSLGINITLNIVIIVRSRVTWRSQRVGKAHLRFLNKNTRELANRMQGRA